MLILRKRSKLIQAITFIPVSSKWKLGMKKGKIDDDTTIAEGCT